MKFFFLSIFLTFILSEVAYSIEVQLRCHSACQNKSYDECKKQHYENNKKYETKENIEKYWLRDTTLLQIFDDKLISTLDEYKFVLNKININSEKYYVFYRAIKVNNNDGRFQILAIDRSELISLIKNFTVKISNDQFYWPEQINNEKKLLDYINYMFIKHKNPKYDDKKEVFNVANQCKIVASIEPKF